MALNGIIALVLRYSLNLIALLAKYVTYNKMMMNDDDDDSG